MAPAPRGGNDGEQGEGRKLNGEYGHSTCHLHCSVGRLPAKLGEVSATTRAETPDTTPGGSDPPRRPVFVTTHWSVVVTAGRSDTPGAQAALEKLCRTYWFPLYVYARQRGLSVEDAQDLTQEFFARVLERHWLARGAPASGARAGSTSAGGRSSRGHLFAGRGVL
jgi:hypothetical protein